MKRKEFLQVPYAVLIPFHFEPKSQNKKDLVKFENHKKNKALRTASFFNISKARGNLLLLRMTQH